MTGKRPAFLIGMAAILLAPPIAYSLTTSTPLAGLVLLCAIAFTIFTRLDELAEFSLGPLRARMRETIAEAAATTEELRNLGLAFARVVLTDLIAGNFLAGMNNAQRLRLHDEVMQTLDAIGASVEQKQAVESDWNKAVAIIYERGIRSALMQEMSVQQSNEVNAKFQKLGDFGQWIAASPDQIDELIATEDLSPSEEARTRLADYRHFLATGDIRRRAEFVKW